MQAQVYEIGRKAFLQLIDYGKLEYDQLHAPENMSFVVVQGLAHFANESGARSSVTLVSPRESLEQALRAYELLVNAEGCAQTKGRVLHVAAEYEVWHVVEDIKPFDAGRMPFLADSHQNLYIDVIPYYWYEHMEDYQTAGQITVDCWHDAVDAAKMLARCRSTLTSNRVFHHVEIVKTYIDKDGAIHSEVWGVLYGDGKRKYGNRTLNGCKLNDLSRIYKSSEYKTETALASYRLSEGLYQLRQAGKLAHQEDDFLRNACSVEVI